MPRAIILYCIQTHTHKRAKYIFMSLVVNVDLCTNRPFFCLYAIGLTLNMAMVAGARNQRTLEVDVKSRTSKSINQIYSANWNNDFRWKEKLLIFVVVVTQVNVYVKGQKSCLSENEWRSPVECWQIAILLRSASSTFSHKFFACLCRHLWLSRSGLPKAVRPGHARSREWEDNDSALEVGSRNQLWS